MALTDVDVDRWRRRLTEERAAAALQVEELTATHDELLGSADEPQDDEHDPDGAGIAVTRGEIAGVLDQARERLAELDEALQRLDEGAYGTCESCGKAIADERLRALPGTRTCVRCAAAPEKLLP